ncbi:hypothetical protein HBP99_05700 [Listeria booriae]|uniref:hypothetical protein n=1 Tax=Listeria booriae TaxID=1552123 RepID=UPI001628706A|nr:hypothetical protein [Listeria booriae]MBC2368119.1 hypothetical protein [Listeria booriae]
MQKFKCTGFSNSNPNHPAKDILGKEIYFVVEPQVGLRAVFQVVDEEATINTSAVDRIIPNEKEPRTIIFFTRNSLYVFEATECSFCEVGNGVYPIDYFAPGETTLRLRDKKLIAEGVIRFGSKNRCYKDEYSIQFCPKCGKSLDGEQP